MATVGIALGAGLTGCYEPPPMSFAGNLEIRGPQLGGDWTLDPGFCMATWDGGIDVSSLYGERCIRIYRRANTSPEVVVFPPGEINGIAFTESDCEAFYVRLERVVDQHDTLYSHGGELILACTNEAGTVLGELQFDGCW